MAAVRRSPRVRELREELEHELMFEGLKMFAVACREGAEEIVADEGLIDDSMDDGEREMVLCMCMGRIVKEFLDGPVENGLSYGEYCDGALERLRAMHAEETARRRKEAERQAEESGYRIEED